MDGGFWQAGGLSAEDSRERLTYYRAVFPGALLALLIPLLIQRAAPYMTPYDSFAVPVMLAVFGVLSALVWLRLSLHLVEPLLLASVNLFLVLRLAFTLAAPQVTSPSAELGVTLPWMMLALFANAWIWLGRPGLLLNVGTVFAMSLCVLAWWPAALPSPERQHLSLTLVQLLLASATVVTGQLVIARRHASLTLETRRARRDADLDSLTTLPNRRALTEQLNLRSARPGGLLAVALIDVDHFKAVNDQYGHARGDDVLKSVGLSLRGQLGNRGVVGRYGGEEFLCLLDVRDEQEARRLCEGLRLRVSAQPLHGVPVTISVGLALCESPVHPLPVLEAADAAMYRAKAQGRNCVQLTVMLRPSPDGTPAQPEGRWRPEGAGSPLN
ncbi:GGDEF domain-containing protein [Deinococcus koreensis]|uniref:GGDEF domain-containing protein n=1 Tax=Deinococcus koreensis TaxID=2054903 RepID=A0A2K3V017_9DEIO|nr:GGDEF domain-containing protein [Deinococcus koreensis]PNY82127.1 hypothetical protein CVO96_12775 [Deinococcus koreensis]